MLAEEKQIPHRISIRTDNVQNPAMRIRRHEGSSLRVRREITMIRQIVVQVSQIFLMMILNRMPIRVTLKFAKALALSGSKPLPDQVFAIGNALAASGRAYYQMKYTDSEML